MLMAYLAEKPSLRDASCCRVLVVKGAEGRRVYGRSWTLVTCTDAESTCAAMEFAVASFLIL